MSVALTRMTTAMGALGRPAVRLAPLSGDGTSMVPWVVGGGCVLLLGSLAFFIDPKLGLAALGLPAVPFLVLHPAHALLAFIAAMPFDAVASLLPDRTLTLTRLLGVGVLGCWIVHVLVRRERVRLTLSGLLLAGYVAYAAASYFWADNPEATARQLQTIAQLFLLYVMTANLVASAAAMERALNVLVAATALLGFFVLWQMPSGGPDTRATLQYGEQHFDPNFLAATLAITAVAAAVLGRARGALGWWRIAALLPMLGAIAATGSRGGAVAFVAGIGILALARPRLGLRAAGFLILVGLALPLVLPPTMLDHFVERFTLSGEDRLSGRLDIWKVALMMIGDRPLQGTGFACFRDAFYHYMATAGVDPTWALQNSYGGRVAHNVYLGTFAELGFVGLGLLVGGFVFHGLGLYRTWRGAAAVGDQRLANMALAMLCVLVSFMVCGNNIDLMLLKSTWVMLGLIQGVILIGERTGLGALRR